MAEQAPSPPSALAVFYRPIEKLIPYARNARVHGDEQLAQIAASMVEFGWTNPVLTDGSDGIIAGHGRVLAARRVWDAGKEIRNCPTGEVPCIDLFGLTETQKRALILADNRIALNAGWDANLLSLELQDLKGLGVDIPALGFSGAEIGALLESAGRGGDGSGSLSEKFGVPPFTVLNAREGWWQERKSAWISLGIQSELGRGENLLKFSETAQMPARKGGRRKKNG